MPPSSPSSLNPLAAEFFPPNKSLLQPLASSSACDVASLVSLFSPSISSKNLSFSFDHLIVAVISAYSYGLTALSSGLHPASAAQIPSSSTICQASPHPESPSPTLTAAISSFEFPALEGVSRSTVSGHPQIAPALNTLKPAAPLPPPKPTVTVAATSSFSSSSWKIVSPNRHSRPRFSRVPPALNTKAESQSIPLTNSFEALATVSDDEKRSDSLAHNAPVPVTATAVPSICPSDSITLNTNCSNALVKKKVTVDLVQTLPSISESIAPSFSSSSSPSSSSSLSSSSPLSSSSSSSSSSSCSDSCLLSPAMITAIYSPKIPREHWEGPRPCDVLGACTDPSLQKDYHSVHQEILRKFEYENTLKKRLTRAQSDKLSREQSLLRIARDVIQREIAARKAK